MPNVPNNTLQVFGINSGLSRNDGTNGLGTRSLRTQIVVNTVDGETGNIDNIPTQEADDSPTIERAEQCTVVHHYNGSYNNCITLLSIYGRGTLVTDAFGNFYRVLSSNVQYQKPGRAILIITCEAISFDVPPDEFRLTPVDLGLDILKHPRYFYNLMPTNQIPNFSGTPDTPSQISAKQTIIRAIQAYRENPVVPTSANINGMISLLHDSIISSFVSGKFTFSLDNPNFNPEFAADGPDPIGTTYAGGLPYPPAASGPDDKNPQIYFASADANSADAANRIALACAAAQELIGKLWRQEDTPPIAGVEMEWSEYSFLQDPLNLGGYVEDPIGFNTPDGTPQATPLLPDYFISTVTPPNPNSNIFQKLSQFNPQVYATNGQFNGPVSISWMRMPDTSEFVRTWWRKTRKWRGAFVGAWDSDINGGQYSGGNRPTQPNHYRNLILS